MRVDGLSRKPEMRTRIKICCIATSEEASIAVAAGADALGFVSDMPSGRDKVISDARIAEIVGTTPPPVATVLLTSRIEAEAIVAQIRATRPSAVQIVSPVDPRELERLARIEPGVRRIQVVHVGGPEALDAIADYGPYVHAFLLDSGRPGGATPELGGTGRVHDWAISARFVLAATRPVFLAGGLTAENAGQAIRAVRPYGLDVCSGVQTDGRLDPKKLAAFMRATKFADEAIYDA